MTEIATNWLPIESLPLNAAMVIAQTADGREMRWPAWLLRDAMKKSTPKHLRFDAVRFAFVGSDYQLSNIR